MRLVSLVPYLILILVPYLILILVPYLIRALVRLVSLLPRPLRLTRAVSLAGAVSLARLNDAVDVGLGGGVDGYRYAEVVVVLLQEVVVVGQLYICLCLGLAFSLNLLRNIQGFLRRSTEALDLVLESLYLVQRCLTLLLDALDVRFRIAVVFVRDGQLCAEVGDLLGLLGSRSLNSLAALLLLHVLLEPGVTLVYSRLLLLVQALVLCLQAEDVVAVLAALREVDAAEISFF